MAESFRRRFASWLNESDWSGAEKKSFFATGLVVFDTNALLTLYKIDPTARDQVVDVLKTVKDRFWIPHQVGLEFARNRDKTVKGRYAEITSARDLAKRTEKKVIASIEEAIETLIDVRTRSLSQREWDRTSFGLAKEDLDQKFDGILSPVIAELDAMKSEQDSSIKRIQDHDPVLDKLDPILTGRVGNAYSSTELWKVVTEAEEFRFPNEIPPGYKDKDKPTMLGRAGDFILWRQLLDKVGNERTITKVILVTNDIKADWWQIDDNGRPIYPRPELVQEMQEQGRSSLLVLTLANFMANARDHLYLSVSTDTVNQLRNAEPIAETEESESRFRWLYRIPAIEFQKIVYELLLRMGFESISDWPAEGRDRGLDFVMSHTNTRGETTLFGIEVKRSLRGIAPGRLVARLSDSMDLLGLNHGIIVTLSPVSASLAEAAQTRRIRFMSAPELFQVIDTYQNHGDGGRDTAEEEL
ncbi:PIN-like domain-containing protein [Lentzea sp. NPDC004789]